VQKDNNWTHLLVEENIKYRQPKVFINTNRLDIVIKYRYIEEYIRLQKGDIPNKYLQALADYKKCILARNNKRLAEHVEMEPVDPLIPNQPVKYNIDDYVESFNNLINSFAQKGFDNRYPVLHCGKQFNLIGGSHRVACAFYFDTRVPSLHKGKQKIRPWNKDWFLDAGFTISDINALIRDYERLKNG